MTVNNKVKMRLQGHEKFSLREGWLNKGIILVDKNPAAFQGKNGPDIFGIGNNMVKSLRYWLRAFGLIRENSTKGAFLTDTGKLILENDPYFEDLFTIWVLHSNISKNIEEATSWYMFFNRMDIDDLDKDQIERVLLREVTKYAAGSTFSENSVKNDLDVIINMYSKSRIMTDPEDKNTSPLAQLELVKNIDGKYSKIHPDMKKVDEWVVLYELSHLLIDRESISIEEVIDGEKGLSKIYQISSVVANELIDRLDSMEYIRVNRTAGLDVIYKTNDISPERVVDAYYKNNRR